MSRKTMIEQAEDLPVIPPELGPALKMAGAVFQDEMLKRVGDAAYLSAEERKTNKDALAIVEETDLEIRLGGKRLRFVPAEEGKPILKFPYGMSDKTATATKPHDWIEGQLGAALISIFDGDEQVFLALIDRMCAAIDAASITDPETGRLKIDQKLLPPVRYAVAVSEGLERLKRTFKTKSAGSPQVNMGFVFEDIPSEPVPEPVVEGPSLDDMKARVLGGFDDDYTMPPTDPAAEYAPEPDALLSDFPDNMDMNMDDDEAMAAYIEAGLIEEIPAPEPVVVVESEPVDEEPLLLIQPDLDVNKPSDLEAVILAAFSHATVSIMEQGETTVCPDGVERRFFTMGQVKKAVADLSTFDLLKEASAKQLSKAAASLVEQALMASTGERRGKRYAVIEMDTTWENLSIDEILAQDEEDGFIPAQEEAVIELKATDDTDPKASFYNPCAMCNNAEAVFTDNDTPIGPRSFCTENCWCEYTGSDYHGEGHYGFTTAVAVSITNPHGLPRPPAQPAFVEVAEEVLEEANEAVEDAHEAGEAPPSEGGSRDPRLNALISKTLSGEMQG